MKSEANTNVNSAEPLRLEKLTWDNYDAIINLHVSREQRESGGPLRAAFCMERTIC